MTKKKKKERRGASEPRKKQGEMRRETGKLAREKTEAHGRARQVVEILSEFLRTQERTLQADTDGYSRTRLPESHA